MDSMEEYIRRLDDPAVHSFNRRLRGVDEQGPPPTRSKVTEDHIAAAEEALGIALPPGYRKLVLTAQPFDVEYGVYWVADGETDQFASDIVSINRGPHAWFPPFLIAVLGDDSGDEYCFDTRHPDERGEYLIVHLNHEIHSEDSTEFEVVARIWGSSCSDRWAEKRRMSNEAMQRTRLRRAADLIR
jgi:cell wall assembly regulator SMI1